MHIAIIDGNPQSRNGLGSNLILSRMVLESRQKTTSLLLDLGSESGSFTEAVALTGPTSRQVVLSVKAIQCTSNRSMLVWAQRQLQLSTHSSHVSFSTFISLDLRP